MTVGDITLVDRDRDRAAAHIGEQAIVDLQRSLPAVAAVAELGQRTGDAFEVARRQVVEHQVTCMQMPRGELLLDRVLPLQQPVHRCVQIILARIGHAKVRSQRRGLPPARGGQLRMRRDDACGNHGQHAIALAARPRADQVRNPQPLHGYANGGHMPVRSRVHHFEMLCRRGQTFTAQDGADRLDR